MFYSIDDISNFPYIHEELGKKKRREQVRKKKPNPSEKLWEDHEDVGTEEKRRRFYCKHMGYYGLQPPEQGEVK
ncbi:hypothetical protein [Pasteuria penetrans]|uniref:hypothetical protein n=1 Tax=Pasteuria penetrans TaxID=86005 RepID=UPI000FB7C43B|nr:hypothetical protein [Pasteuria penetrans]